MQPARSLATSMGYVGATASACWGREAMSDSTAIVVLILGTLALGVLGRFLRNRQRLRLQEMAHQERILAMEKGLPVSELPGGDLEPWSGGISAHGPLESGWDRRMTLAVGLVMLFASIGSLLFAWLLPPTDSDAVGLKMAAALGVIPLMASFGLLLYYRLTAPKSQ